MLTSNIYMMMQSISTPVNSTEFIAMRGGFSIYSGWVTAATILNATYMLKSFGVADPDLAMDEEEITCEILGVAWLIYTLVAYTERNPLYGSMLLYVVYAIRDNIVNNKPQYTKIEESANWILGLHGISMVFLWSWISAEVYYDVDLNEGWNTGLFYELEF